MNLCFFSFSCTKVVRTFCFFFNIYIFLYFQAKNKKTLLLKGFQPILHSFPAICYCELVPNDLNFLKFQHIEVIGSQLNLLIQRCMVAVKGDMQFRIHMKFRLPYESLCNEFSYTPENSSTNV